MLANGDFSNGQDHWLTWISTEASAYGSVQNGEFVMSIDNGGSESFHVQLIQTDLLIEHGKTYTVSFDAYADGSRTMSMFIQKNSDPWNVYYVLSDVTLTTNKQHFSTSFKIVEPQEVPTQTPYSGDPVHLTGTLEAENYPNPFNSSSMIRYTLPQPGHVTLEIFDMLGEKICKLFDSFQDSGSHIIEWNAGSNKSDKITSGIYFLSIEAVCDRQTFTSMKKMILIK